MQCAEREDLIVHSILAKLWPDLELFKRNTISSPGGSIVCLVSPKKSYKLNSFRRSFLGRRLSSNLVEMVKNLNFDKKVVETPFFFNQNDRI